MRVGTLAQRGDHTRFIFSDTYLDDVHRPVLGLAFEQDLHQRHAAALRLPCWFSNLLPEGRLREWIAADRGVSAQREMELLAQVGHDLPGAVRIRRVDDQSGTEELFGDAVAGTPRAAEDTTPSPWRFSLAGVALKFSMLAEHDRLTLPAAGRGGDWIVKLPDRMYADVPRNEFAMMSLARSVGIDVPEVRLVHRDELIGLPPGVWAPSEHWAYAVRRFDRTPRRELVHIEDLAQVRNIYPDDKYTGSYETVAALLYRGHDIDSVVEFARRLVFNILISNGDAHLKNWSLRYLDPRRPSLAPAYDLVSTMPYMGTGEEFGLRFGGTKRYEKLRLMMFRRLESTLGIDVDLAEVGRQTVENVKESWPDQSDVFNANRALHAEIGGSIAERSQTLLRA